MSSTLDAERRRLSLGLGVSLLVHALLLALTFGGQGLGLPGLSFPWQERRGELPEDLRIVLAPAPAPVPPPVLADKAPEDPTEAAPMAREAQAAEPAGQPQPAPDLIALPPSDQTNWRVPSPSPTPAPVLSAATSASSPPLPEPPVQKAADEEAARERVRQEAMEQARLAEQAAQAERAEAARQALARQELARAEAARLEAERQELVRQEAARAEAARAEAASKEAQRQAALQQEAARLEAAARAEVERQEAAKADAAKAEAARQEAARAEAARQEAARAEAARQEAARAEAARQEAARQEAARQEAARQEALRAEAARAEAARQEAARPDPAKEAEARREARLKAIGRQLDEENDRRDAAAAARPSPLLGPSASSLRRGRLFGYSDPNAELVLYAEAWARRIQLNQTFELVREAAKQPHVDPMVTVAIRSNGSIESVNFVRSSGVPALDEAVRRVIDSLAPYPEFAPGLSREFDVVEIRRTWHFDSAIRLN